MKSGAPRGTIFNIQKFSTEDGPGIRTTVFLKGCPLRCLWCHNPESISRDPQLVWHGPRCIGDHACIEACHHDALSAADTGITIDRSVCEHCGNCTAVCPTGALEIIGREMTVEEVMAEILKDELFYRQSGGGVTFSGGEPTLQYEFLTSLLYECRRAGIHTALDTCGHNRREIFESLASLIDLVLYDLKCLDDGLHRRSTGVGIDLIIGNLRYLDSTGIPIWIRTPVIPGYTDQKENIGSIARFIKQELKNVKRYDLLSFSNLCKSKYDELGVIFNLGSAALIKETDMKDLEAVTHEQGVDNVVISGMMRRD